MTLKIDENTREKLNRWDLNLPWYSNIISIDKVRKSIWKKINANLDSNEVFFWKKKYIKYDLLLNEEIILSLEEQLWHKPKIIFRDKNWNFAPLFHQITWKNLINHQVFDSEYIYLLEQDYEKLIKNEAVS